MASTAPPCPGRSPSLAEVLHRVAEELRGLATISADLQSTLSSLLLDRAPLDAGHATRLQSLDLLEQALDDLACFLEQLSADGCPPCHPSVTAAASVLRLAALGARLSCPDGAPANRTANAPPPDNDAYEVWT